MTQAKWLQVQTISDGSNTCWGWRTTKVTLPCIWLSWKGCLSLCSCCCKLEQIQTRQVMMLFCKSLLYCGTCLVLMLHVHAVSLWGCMQQTWCNASVFHALLTNKCGHPLLWSPSFEPSKSHPDIACTECWQYNYMLWYIVTLHVHLFWAASDIISDNRPWYAMAHIVARQDLPESRLVWQKSQHSQSFCGLWSPRSSWVVGAFDNMVCPVECPCFCRNAVSDSSHDGKTVPTCRHCKNAVANRRRMSSMDLIVDYMLQLLPCMFNGLSCVHKWHI